MSVYVGIDPGKSGAVALLYDDNSLDVFDISVFYDSTGASKCSANPRLVNDWIAWKLKRKEVALCVCEKPIFAGRGFHIQTTMSTHESYGVFRCAFETANIPFRGVEPSTWLKSFPDLYHPKKRREKMESVCKAKELFPDSASLFERACKKGKKIIMPDRAEAALIAYYGRASSH